MSALEARDEEPAPPAAGARPGSVYQEAWCAGAYDEDRFGGAFGRDLLRREIALYLELTRDSPEPMLDAGAGTGKLSIAFLESRRRVASLDHSLEMLRIARLKALSGALAGAFTVGDLASLCFRDRAFGCTVSSRVLMHLPDWKASVGELCRVTREVLVIDFPPRSGFARWDALVKRLLPRRGGRRPAHGSYRTFSLGEVTDELRHHRFQVVEVRRGYVLPLALHRKLNRPTASRRLERALEGIGLSNRLGAPVTLKAVRLPAP